MRVSITNINFIMSTENAKILLAILELEITGETTFYDGDTQERYSVNKIGPPEHDTYELWGYKKRDIGYIANKIKHYSKREIYDALTTGEFY